MWKLCWTVGKVLDITGPGGGKLLVTRLRLTLAARTKLDSSLAFLFSGDGQILLAVLIYDPV